MDSGHTKTYLLTINDKLKLIVSLKKTIRKKTVLPIPHTISQFPLQQQLLNDPVLDWQQPIYI